MSKTQWKDDRLEMARREALRMTGILSNGGTNRTRKRLFTYTGIKLTQANT